MSLRKAYVAMICGIDWVYNVVVCEKWLAPQWRELVQWWSSSVQLRLNIRRIILYFAI